MPDCIDHVMEKFSVYEHNVGKCNSLGTNERSPRETYISFSQGEVLGEAWPEVVVIQKSALRVAFEYQEMLSSVILTQPYEGRFCRNGNTSERKRQIEVISKTFLVHTQTKP